MVSQKKTKRKTTSAWMKGGKEFHERVSISAVESLWQWELKAQGY
jgi:hypothetical protein